MEQIQWLEGGGCLIDGKVWVTIISPIRTLGLGYEMKPAIMGSLTDYQAAMRATQSLFKGVKR